VKEEKRKNNGIITSTNLPTYYLAQLSCDSAKEEEQWTRRDKHICSDKNDMCLTVSPNIKDGGIFVNLMAYEETARSQQWTAKSSNSRAAVALFNVGTSWCLFEPMDENKSTKANTTVKRCPQPKWYSENLFYFERTNLKDQQNCAPL